MLKINNVVKEYAKGKPNAKLVLKGINLEILSGEIFGLIGANGAGKTTLMNIISQIINATEGTIEIDGQIIKSLNELRGKVGYILDIPAMHEYLTPMEYLEYLASPQGLKKEELTTRSIQLLEQVGLEGSSNQRIKGFSRGMKQRMGIAAGLITNPPIILMDEPSSALDPKGRFEVIEIIKKLAKQGKTIILSTHILSDVEKVCTRVGLLVEGNIIITGTLKEVFENFNEDAYDVVAKTEDLEKLEKMCKKSPIIEGVVTNETKTAISIYYKKGKKNEAFKVITSSDIEIDNINIRRPSMEEIFIKTSVPQKLTKEGQ